MAKITATEIKALGFAYQQFQLASEDAFTIYINLIIAEEAERLEADIGSDLYDSADTRLKRIEKYRVAAEMLSRRINIRLANISGAGEGFDLSEERRQLERYVRDSDTLLVALGGPGDYAGGVLETSHFQEGEGAI
jgi:hypothetical protein